jgi:cleavage stimulation factor subunit 1
MIDSKQVYQLIISQLIEDGYTQAALSVSEATMTPFSPDTHQRGRLTHLVTLGTIIEKDKGLLPTSADKEDMSMHMDVNDVIKEIRGIDLDLEIQGAAPFPNFQTKFIATHKNSTTCAKFDPEGKFAATGSADTSIKILEVDKMLLFGNSKGEKDKEFEDQQTRPVTRIFYDHTACVTDIDFHPAQSIIASSSLDCSVRLYDYISPTAKRSIHTYADTQPIRSLSFHPTGDYLITSTDHTSLRLWDIESQKAYISPRTELNHFGAINMVRYSSDGKLYATCSQDGSIKFWDGITNDCINTITNAHGSLDVYSVQFSKNRKYLLTCGKDCTVRLWDITAGGRQIKRIYCGNSKGPVQHWEGKVPASFSFNEDFILTGDETNGVVAWDTRTGDLVQKLAGHNQIVRALAASPTKAHLMTGSDDHRVRFWVEEATETQL